jgi:UDP-2,3-diacylglucosamine pyrophosphatase LpxH
LKKLHSVWISDTHLGSCFSRSKELLEFLKLIKEYEPRYLYLVGDFIDGWKLQRSWYWDDNCNLIIRKILSMVKHGTIVYWIAGNHDEFMRNFMHDTNLGSIHLGDEFVHTCIDGRKLLVVHGDKFDIAFTMKYTKWLCKLGDIGYGYLIRMNKCINNFRKLFGLKYWSFSQAIKSTVKQATSYIGGFETILANYAKEKELQGVVAGHIHCPTIKTIDGVTYYNCGDWVENCTAILEYHDGKIELYNHELNI